MNAELEKWIEENSYKFVRLFGGDGEDELCVTVNNLRALFEGKVLVPVESINKALHGLEHLKADIQARSKLQEDYQEGVVMVGSGAWHGLCSAIIMLAATKEKGE